jgi:hypothetical protein
MYPKFMTVIDKAENNNKFSLYRFIAHCITDFLISCYRRQLLLFCVSYEVSLSLCLHIKRTVVVLKTESLPQLMIKTSRRSPQHQCLSIIRSLHSQTGGELAISASFFFIHVLRYKDFRGFSFLFCQRE